MPILGKHLLIASFYLAVIGLGGCQNPGSPEYQMIEKLHYSEWEAFAYGLPVEKRLDLHKEILERSGHNPSMTISSAFNDDPGRAYSAIVDRIRGGDGSRAYVSILYEINRQDGFDICDQLDRDIVQRYLWEVATNAVEPDKRAKFYSC